MNNDELDEYRMPVIVRTADERIAELEAELSERNIIKKIHAMGSESLDPESFTKLEEVIEVLCETRAELRE